MLAIVIPNIPKAELPFKRKINTKEERVAAVCDFGVQYKNTILFEKWKRYQLGGCLVVLKWQVVWFLEERIEHENTHETGSSISSAVTRRLAAGYDMPISVSCAKAYITCSIAAGLNIGRGNGPLNHMYCMDR